MSNLSETLKAVGKIMLSFSREAERMIREMCEKPPFYGRVGALSIVAEQAVRTLYKTWKATEAQSKKRRKPQTAQAKDSWTPELVGGGPERPA